MVKRLDVTANNISIISIYNGIISSYSNMSDLFSMLVQSGEARQVDPC